MTVWMICLLVYFAIGAILAIILAVDDLRVNTISDYVDLIGFFICVLIVILVWPVVAFLEITNRLRWFDL